jgi:hypothetical protein
MRAVRRASIFAISCSPDSVKLVLSRILSVIPAHSLASSSFDVNGTLGEQFDFPWWS